MAELKQNCPIYDLAIIGGGPAGYEAAFEAAKHGLTVVIIEYKALGGTCLNCGCIPTKSLLHQAKLFANKGTNKPISLAEWQTMIAQTQRLINRSNLALSKKMEQLSITVICDKVSQIERNSLVLINNQKLTFRKLILATGTIPFVPELFKSEVEQGQCYTNETIFSLQEPPEHLIILGGGVIGIEIAFLFSLLNIPVTLCEALPSILPNHDPDIVKEIKVLLKRSRVKLIEGNAVTSINHSSLILHSGQQIDGSHILIATGRKPSIPSTTFVLRKSTSGYIEVSKSYETSEESIYAIGDCNGLALYAHAASDQARQLISFLIYQKPVQIKPLPRVIYTTPSFAATGLSEDSPQAKGALIHKTPMSALGMAQIEQAGAGWVKLISLDKRLIGAVIYSNHAEELISYYTLAIQENISLENLKSIIFPHPSLSELVSMNHHSTL